MTGDYVQVASVQTLIRRIDRMPAPDLIVIDEAHHANASTWRQIINTWPSARLLGVTATPFRLDGTGLGTQSGGFFDKLIEGPSIRWLIDEGFLSQPVIYAPPTDLDLTGVRVKLGDYEQRELSVRMDKPKITGSAIEHYSRYCPGEPAIAFCSSVEHAEHVSQQFQDAGIASVPLTGEMADSVRKHRINALASGQIKVLTACDIISEGTDIPVVSCGILLRPTQSLVIFLQQCGRVLRPYPGKKHATILDHAGNCLRHGMVDDEREWSLNHVKESFKKKKEGQDEVAANLRLCEKCYAVMPATKLVCPQCGHIHHAKGRSIKEVEGDLVMMNAARAEKIRVQARMEVGQAKSLHELTQLARQRGYNTGWAYHVYNSRKAKEFQDEFAGVGA
jgi:superfamily II DNA or RNA helicase